MQQLLQVMELLLKIQQYKKVQQLHANPVKKPAGKKELDQAAARRKHKIQEYQTHHTTRN